MKRVLCLAAVSALVGCASAAMDVYLLLGQSNMSGRGTLTPENRVSHERVLKFSQEGKWVVGSEPLHFDSEHCGAGLGATFARMVADADPKSTVGLVPCAVGGASLAQWMPDGELYKKAVERTRAALKEGGEIKGILWHQGCSDSTKKGDADTYAARLVVMVKQLRSDLNAPNAPFLVGGLPPFLDMYVKEHGKLQHWHLVAAKLKEAVAQLPLADYIRSGGLHARQPDLVHFETPALRTFGERYATRMLELQGRQLPPKPTVIRPVVKSDLEELGRETKPMRTEQNSEVIRQVELSADFVVAGGGISGICAALSAARHGAQVVLVQDRPMLGGNASSEIRMGIMGAHGDQNKEAGILEELQLRNFYYNPLMRYTLWDDVMYSAVVEEQNITLLLNTSVDGVEMAGERIAAVKAWNSNAYTRYVIKGKLFADCTGDGILRLSGAKFRHGREFPEEFGENFTMVGGDHRTMGNSILLQLRKTNSDHPFHAPAWAYKFSDADFVNDDQPKDKGRHYSYKRLYPDNNNFWWVEFGGNIDTIGDANAIQFELKRIAYGVWEYMKNHPDGRCRGYDLDWIGSIPGKRESVRLIGPHIMTQHDVMGGGRFEDVVAYGGWTLDDHHPDAFWKQGHLSQHHVCPSPFGIPFDCLYSVNVPNLLFAGRNISCTHMALSATRVMGTCATLGQAVGTAAAIALKHQATPAEVRQKHLALLQDTLEDDDCMLPYRWRKVSGLTQRAVVAENLESLRNGIDRTYDKQDHGIWCEVGAANLVYSWSTPQKVSGVRLVFDSDMRFANKRMLKLEAEHGRQVMPKMLAKGFRVEARVDGAWQTVYAEQLNLARLRKIAFAPVEADALRVVVTETWGKSKAHIYAFDAL